VERKCLKLNAQVICLLTQSLSLNIEALILKEHGVPMDAHLLWKYIKEKFSETIAVQDSREADYLTKLVSLVVKIGQAGMAKSTGSRLHRKKRYQSNQNSTSQTSSLPSTSHGKCLMAKGKQEKKPLWVESEEEEEDKDDLEFDKLSKKDKIKIKRLIERIKEQELQLKQQEEYLIGKIEELKDLHEVDEKLKHSHTSLIDPLEKENANLKTQLEVLTSKHVKLQKDHEVLKCSHDNLQDEHVMLQVSHEVVVTSVRHFQPLTQKCACSLNSISFVCANACCSQSQQSSVEQIHVDSCDDIIAKK
jgi:hypothetical protein